MGDLHIKVGGAWKAIDAASVKVGGSWKDVENIYCKVGGAWKTVWNALTISLADTSTVSSNDSAGNTYTALCGYKVKRDGTVVHALNQNTSAFLVYSFRENWATPPSATIGDAYHVRFTDNSQSGPAATLGGVIGSWVSLTGDREVTWGVDADSAGAAAVVSITAEISDDGGTTTLASVTFNMSAREEV